MRARTILRALAPATALHAALLATGSLQAAPEPKEEICTSVNWSGNLDDVRNIRTVPVPNSYRSGLNRDECSAPVNGDSLITWHLAFGDERSTTAALAFLEQSARFKVPDPQAWLSGLQAREPSAGGQRRTSLVLTHRRFVFLAEQSLRAAEFFPSAALLDRARRYLAAASEGVRVLSPAMNDVYDLEARAAVLKARLSRSAADVQAATALLDTHDFDLLKRAAEEAFQHGDSLCDTGGQEHLAEIATACRMMGNGFEMRVTAYWRSRAQLDLLADDFQSRKPDSFRLAMKLLRHSLSDPAEPEQRPVFDPAADDMAALLVQRFEAEDRAVDPAAPDAHYEHAYALGFLVRAARPTAPAMHPGRFRQIAERYLEAWRPLARAANAHQTWLDAWLAREAAYFERVLADLPQIAIGDVPAAPADDPAARLRSILADPGPPSVTK